MCRIIYFFFIWFCSEYITPVNLIYENDGDLNNFKVGIVGAGISGLYSALMLQDLGIEYDVFEASQRAGGRFYTHYFNDESENINYVEMGARRFPNVSFYDRIIGRSPYSIVNYLNDRLLVNQKLELFNVMNEHPKNIYYFNKMKAFREDVVNKSDVLGFVKFFGGNVPNCYAKKGAFYWWNKAMNLIKSEFDKSFDNGFKYLLRHDTFSLREFLMQKEELKYPPAVVDWIETMTLGTGFFTHGLFDNYFSLSFVGSNFVSIRGGVSRLVDAIILLLKSKPKLSEQVLKIECDQFTSNIKIKTENGIYYFDYVILTQTYSAMRNMKFKNCDLNFEKKNAMRILHYLTSTKISLNFKSRFWENYYFMKKDALVGGISFTDLKIREIVYPFYPNNCSHCEASLIASYTFARDSNLLDNYNENKVIEKCLQDLYEIYGSVIYSQFTGEYFIKRWHLDELIGGSFPLLDSGHFTELFPCLLSPEGNGRLHFAGATHSLFHAWSIAAFMSAYRSVKNILIVNKNIELLQDFERKWKFHIEPNLDKLLKPCNRQHFEL